MAMDEADTTEGAGRVADSVSLVPVLSPVDASLNQDMVVMVCNACYAKPCCAMQ